MKIINGTSSGSIGVQSAVSSSGILHPKMKNRFRVLFEDAKGSRIAQDVSLQVINVSGLTQRRGGGGVDVVLEVEDDVTNRACIGLQDLMLQADFKMRVEHLDGNENVTRTYLIEDANIEEIHHSELDYASSEKLTKGVLIFALKMTIS